MRACGRRATGTGCGCRRSPMSPSLRAVSSSQDLSAEAKTQQDGSRSFSNQLQRNISLTSYPARSGRESVATSWHSLIPIGRRLPVPDEPMGKSTLKRGNARSAPTPPADRCDRLLFGDAPVKPPRESSRCRSRRASKAGPRAHRSRPGWPPRLGRPRQPDVRRGLRPPVHGARRLPRRNAGRE
jgi:hypothetical protein